MSRSVRVSYKDYILHMYVVLFFFCDRRWEKKLVFSCRLSVCVSECAKEQGIGKRMTSANHKADATATRFPSSAAAAAAVCWPQSRSQVRVASHSQAKSWLWPAVKELKPKLKPLPKLKPSSQVNSRQAARPNPPKSDELNERTLLVFFYLFPLYSSVGLHIIANNNNNNNSRQKCYL